MYLSNVNIPDSTRSLPAAVRRAVEYVKSRDIANMAPGEYPIEGKNMFVRVFDLVTKTVPETFPEVHDRYVDVQYWASGEELMGVAPRTGNEEVERADPSDDIAFLKEAKAERFVYVHEGDFMVLYPWDAHRPGIQVDTPVTERKAVVKVSVDLL